MRVSAVVLLSVFLGFLNAGSAQSDKIRGLSQTLDVGSGVKLPLMPEAYIASEFYATGRYMEGVADALRHLIEARPKDDAFRRCFEETDDDVFEIAASFKDYLVDPSYMFVVGKVEPPPRDIPVVEIFEPFLLKWCKVYAEEP